MVIDVKTKVTLWYISGRIEAPYKDSTDYIFFSISSRGSGIRDQQRFHNRLQHARSPKDDSCIHIIACNIRSFSCSLATDPCELLPFLQERERKQLPPAC